MSGVQEHAFAEDDYPIAYVPNDPFWTENYALTCNDPVNGIGLMAFLGRWCGDPELWREVVKVSLPGLIGWACINARYSGGQLKSASG